MDEFFGSLGGLPWYQLRCLRFIADAAAQREADGSGSNGSAHSSASGAINGSSAIGGISSNVNRSTSNGVNGSASNVLNGSVSHGINGSATLSSGGGGTATVADGEQMFHMPCGVDLECNPQAARRAAAQGLQALPYMAEIYPIGGESSTPCNSVHGSRCRAPK